MTGSAPAFVRHLTAIEFHGSRQRRHVSHLHAGDRVGQRGAPLDCLTDSCIGASRVATALLGDKRGRESATGGSSGYKDIVEERESEKEREGTVGGRGEGYGPLTKRQEWSPLHSW